MNQVRDSLLSAVSSPSCGGLLLYPIPPPAQCKLAFPPQQAGWPLNWTLVTCSLLVFICGDTTLSRQA